jgi:hypothetical protein
MTPNQFLILNYRCFIKEVENKSMKLLNISGPIKDGNINGNLVTVILVLINYRSKIFD